MEHLRCESAKSSDEEFVVDGSQLVERYEAGAILKSTGNAPRISVTRRSHRRDDRCAEMLIQFVG